LFGYLSDSWVVQKYWTTLLEIKLTDVNFPNFPAARTGFLEKSRRWLVGMCLLYSRRLRFACQGGVAGMPAAAMPAPAPAGAAK
jgi:hypothetical protein